MKRKGWCLLFLPGWAVETALPSLTLAFFCLAWILSFVFVVSSVESMVSSYCLYLFALNGDGLHSISRYLVWVVRNVISNYFLFKNTCKHLRDGHVRVAVYTRARALWGFTGICGGFYVYFQSFFFFFFSSLVELWKMERIKLFLKSQTSLPSLFLFWATVQFAQQLQRKSKRITSFSEKYCNSM